MIVQKGAFTQIRFERDLLSWRMDFNWTPLEQMRTGDSSWDKIRGISDIKWDKSTNKNR
jgi:hypothetical protein